jgi:SEC-C motif-containing protein
MKVGRNHPCPCGSGRKFKRCCMNDADDFQAELFETESEPLGREESDPMVRTAHALAAMIADTENAALDKPARDFLAGYPESLFLFLDAFLEAANAVPGGEDEALGDSYYFLLGIELSFLRINLEHRYEWAGQMRDDFEHRIIGAIRSGEASAEQVSAIVNAMIKERVQPSAELMAACEEALRRESAEPDERDPAALCAEIVAECNDDPFMIGDALYSSAHFGGDDLGASSIKVLLGAPQTAMREGAALGVLDSDPKVRSAAATALVEVPDAITPSTLRRLIALRRWLPEPERAPVDQAIRAARLSGVECEQWPPGARVAEIRASAPDGAGAQMAMIVSAADRGHRLSALLFKHNQGIADAWTSDPQPLREIKEMLNEQSSGVRMLPVSRAYLDRMVEHYLRVASQQAAPPSARLLAVAELVEAPRWHPAEFGWREMLEGLIAEVRSELLAPASVQQIINTSAKWAMRRQWAASWAEAGPEVEDLLDRLDGRSVKFVCDKIIDRILEKRREIWMERFTLTALWMKEAPRRANMPWEHFAIVAHSMLNQIPLRNLPLMQRIAEATAFV